MPWLTPWADQLVQHSQCMEEVQQALMLHVQRRSLGTMMGMRARRIHRLGEPARDERLRIPHRLAEGMVMPHPSGPPSLLEERRGELLLPR
eukprot:5892922-Pyramimonas_sp.AAC.2